MFSGFLGRGKKPDGPTSNRDALDSRGLEVVEDDPDTTWGLWESAVAEQDSKFSALPTLDVDSPSFQNTVPMGLPEDNPSVNPHSRRERTLEQRKEDAISTVELHHHRIANTIRTLWGYKECSDYISKLILSGGDGMGHARMGFNQDAANAMMLLAEIHDAEFGVAEPKGGSGFSDSVMRTGYDALR
ncbi:MAG: hypothetical protein V4858_27495 [Pseudomonadota bacterium]